MLFTRAANQLKKKANDALLIQQESEYVFVPDGFCFGNDQEHIFSK